LFSNGCTVNLARLVIEFLLEKKQPRSNIVEPFVISDVLKTYRERRTTFAKADYTQPDYLGDGVR